MKLIFVAVFLVIVQIGILYVNPGNIVIAVSSVITLIGACWTSYSAGKIAAYAHIKRLRAGLKK